METQKLMTMHEVALKVNVHYDTLRKILKRANFQPTKRNSAGGRLWFSEDDVHLVRRLVAEHVRNPKTKQPREYAHAG